MKDSILELFDLSRETVLITGGGTGLGQSFSRVLVDVGATVILSGRRLDKLEAAAQPLIADGGSAHCVPMDVSDPASVAQGIRRGNNISPITILINNAGTNAEATLLELEDDDWDAVMAANLKGAWLVAKEVVAAMVQRGEGGSIVNIASVLATSVQKGTGAYSPSKAGLLQLTRQMALEWARYRVRVNAIAPGYFYTDIASTFLDSEAGRALLQRIPARRLGEPSELDAALLMLCAPASAYTTGSTVYVDGGLSLPVI